MNELEPLTVVAVFANVVLALIIASQFHLQRTENKHKMRPIIVRREFFDFREGQKRPHKLQEDKVLFSIINQGPLSAFNVTMRWYIAILKNHKREDIRSSDEGYFNGKPLPDLGPGESYSIDLFIDKIHYDHIRQSNKEKCVFGVILDYEHENKTKYQYRIDGYFDYEGDLMLLRPEDMHFE